MGRPKKLTDSNSEPEITQTEADRDQLFKTILASLLSNPNFYPKTDYTGVINRANQICEEAFK